MNDDTHDPASDRTLSLHVTDLSVARKFYSMLLGLEVVSRAGLPAHSVFLAFPPCSDSERAIDEPARAHADFILRLTTRRTTDDAQILCIELAGLDDFIRCCFRAGAIGARRIGPIREGAALSMLLWDPDSRLIELTASEPPPPGPAPFESPVRARAARDGPTLRAFSQDSPAGFPDEQRRDPPAEAHDDFRPPFLRNRLSRRLRRRI